MDMSVEFMKAMGAVLLQIVAALLFEELTFGGLVRLLLARRPGSGKRGAACGKGSPQARERGEHMNRKEGVKCLR
jgi:hypothetical protein